MSHPGPSDNTSAQATGSAIRRADTSLALLVLKQQFGGTTLTQGVYDGLLRMGFELELVPGTLIPMAEAASPASQHQARSVWQA